MDTSADTASPSDAKAPDRNVQPGRCRVVQLSLAPIQHDGRVIRSVSALRKAGYECRAVAPGEGLPIRDMSLAVKARVGLLYGAGGRLGRGTSLAAFWSFSTHRQALDLVLALRPHIVHAHDWNSLPIAMRAAERCGCRVIYDAHEFATEMHAERRLWSYTMPRAIRHLEEAGIGRADALICVSDGQARLLGEQYPDHPEIAVVRNIPDSEPIPFRPIDPDRLLLHYHGVLARGRGLRMMLRCIAQLDRRYHLRLTGMARSSSFQRELLSLIDRLGIGDRVTLCPAVAVNALVRRAAAGDIGLNMLPVRSRHNAIALPNKIFEYLQAGMAILSSEGTDINALINKYRCGWAKDFHQENEFPEFISSLSPEMIDEARKNAVSAAKKLTWSAESKSLIAVYTNLARKA